MSQYKIGLISYGEIATVHANIYRATPKTKVIAVAEPDFERRKNFTKDFPDAKIYANLDEMFQNENLDIVSICSSPIDHYNQIITATTHGVKAILCEQPISLNLENATRAIEACRENNVKLVLSNPHTFTAETDQIIELIRGEAIGDLRVVFGFCSENDLLTSGVCVVDLIRLFAAGSEVQWVIGQIDRATEKRELGYHSERGAIGHFHFENGITGIIEQGVIAPSEFGLRLNGSAGTIGFDTIDDELTLQVITKNGELDLALETVDARRSEIDAVIEWIEGGKTHRNSGENALATFEAIMAIMESSRLRGIIEFPIKTQENPLEKMIESDLI